VGPLGSVPSFMNFMGFFKPQIASSGVMTCRWSCGGQSFALGKNFAARRSNSSGSITLRDGHVFNSAGKQENFVPPVFNIFQIICESITYGYVIVREGLYGPFPVTVLEGHTRNH